MDILKNLGQFPYLLAIVVKIAIFGHDGTTSTFTVPEGHEFNISRTVHADIDNLKYVSFLVENGSFEALDDIEKIEITLYFGKIFRKKVTINYQDFPKFNSAKLLNKYEVQI